MVFTSELVGVLIYANLDQLNIYKKVFENVVMDGASTKGSCTSPQRSCSAQHNIDTPLPQIDNVQKLSRMIDKMSNIYQFTLIHNQNKLINFIRVVRTRSDMHLAFNFDDSLNPNNFV